VYHAILAVCLSAEYAGM